MPQEKMIWAPRSEILSWEEMERLCSLFIRLGVEKIRITGGEPFVRKGLMGFLRRIRLISKNLSIGITTNGVLTGDYLPELKEIGGISLNFSLDSLHRETFQQITKRDDFGRTREAIQQALEFGFRTKINMVIQPGMNDGEITEFAGLTKDRDIVVRFIEPMPFNGKHGDGLTEMSGREIFRVLEKKYCLESLGPNKSAIAALYQIRGFRGKIGIINGYTRSFCDKCSRLRLSARGGLRTCLYGVNVLDLKEMLRNGCDDPEIEAAIRSVVARRFKDGHEAEKARRNSRFESMSAIGG